MCHRRIIMLYWCFPTKMPFLFVWFGMCGSLSEVFATFLQLNFSPWILFEPIEVHFYARIIDTRDEKMCVRVCLRCKRQRREIGGAENEC